MSQFHPHTSAFHHTKGGILLLLKDAKAIGYIFARATIDILFGEVQQPNVK
jgi:hypothetical protein